MVVVSLGTTQFVLVNGIFDTTTSLLTVGFVVIVCYLLRNSRVANTLSVFDRSAGTATGDTGTFPLKVIQDAFTRRAVKSGLNVVTRAKTMIVRV